MHTGILTRGGGRVKGIAPLDVGTTRRPVRGQKGRTTRMGFPPLLNFPAFLITVSATASTPGGAGKPRQRLLPSARAVTRAWTVSDRRYPFSHCPVLTSARTELPQQSPYFFGAVLVRNRNGAAVPASGLRIREKGGLARGEKPSVFSIQGFSGNSL